MTLFRPGMGAQGMTVPRYIGGGSSTVSASSNTYTTVPITQPRRDRMLWFAMINDHTDLPTLKVDGVSATRVADYDSRYMYVFTHPIPTGSGARTLLIDHNGTSERRLYAYGVFSSRFTLHDTGSHLDSSDGSSSNTSHSLLTQPGGFAIGLARFSANASATLTGIPQVRTAALDTASFHIGFLYPTVGTSLTFTANPDGSVDDRASFSVAFKRT